MSENTNNKKYDLEERTLELAKRCREFIKRLPKTISNIEDSKQLARSSGSQAANYIEANESLSKKDFVHRIKICRKEAKESRLWLRLCDVRADDDLENLRNSLIKEVEEITKIFGAIYEKSK